MPVVISVVVFSKVSSEESSFRCLTGLPFVVKALMPRTNGKIEIISRDHEINWYHAHGVRNQTVALTTNSAVMNSNAKKR